MKKYHPAGTVLVFLLPSLLGFVIFILLPIISSGVLSFTNYSGGFSLDFIGFRNYIRAFSSPAFRHALGVTVRFVLFTVVLQLFFGLLFALILNRARRGRSLFRGIIVLPTVLSAVAVSLAFVLLFHPEKGPVNGFLQSAGLPPSPWLSSPKTALSTIIIVFLWQTFGYYMVIFLSGLQTIPPVLYDVADLDGSSRLQKLRLVTLPMLSPVMFFCLILAVIRAFQVFGQIYVMTGGQSGGGPAGATSVLVFDIYINGFTHFKFGYASAEAMILLAIVLTITLFQYRGQRRWVNYDLA